MKNGKIFNFTNFLLVVSIVLALTFIYVTYGTYKKFTYEQKKMEAFYVTNAGINQAIWYLSTPPGMGGYGPEWRVSNLKKYFSIGSYTISIENGKAPGEIVITSVGEAGDISLMLQATVVYGRSIPRVFNYALWSGGELSIGGKSSISGDVYVNDNLSLSDDAVIKDGTATTTPGYNITKKGRALFLAGKASRPLPVFPVLDTTYYYNKISHAKSGEPGVIQGDREYENLKLAGNTIYVNGNVTIKGKVSGYGAIVSTRNMTITGKGGLGNGTFFICNGKMSISGHHEISGQSFFYSKQQLSLSDNSSLTGGAVVLSPTVIEMGKGSCAAGLVYAPSVTMGKNAKISGSVAAENYACGEIGVLKDINVKHEASDLPLSVIGFNMGSKMIMRKPGSLREI